MKISEKPPVHLEIQRYKDNCYGILRSTFREDGKILHKSLGRITGLTYDQLLIVREAMKGNASIINSDTGMQVKSSKEYGASDAILAIAKEIGLDTLIYSRQEPWVKNALAMIAGRILYAGSKLSLSNMWKDSSLWEQCGVPGEVNVDINCYKVMDRLLDRQYAIQKAIAKKHLSNGSMILYDITSSYLEGEYEKSDLVKFGYNRDGKKGHEQIVIGMICNSEGCPIAVEVFPGNKQDAATVMSKLDEIKNFYGIKELIFVGDRGMITQANFEKVKDMEGLSTISALTHRQIVSLLEKKTVQLSLFDEKNIVEVTDPENSRLRYCLCKNPYTQKKERETRNGILEKLKSGLEKISKSRSKKADILAARVGKLIEKTKMGKFVIWNIKDSKLVYEIDLKKVEQEESIDGCYIISTTVSKDVLDTKEVIASYKNLSHVEQGFRAMKQILIEIRPMYHRIDRRIRSHVFICMLALYLQWHMKQRLKPLTETDKTKKYTFNYIIERLKSIRKNKIKTGDAEISVISLPDEEQAMIIALLKKKSGVEN